MARRRSLSRSEQMSRIRGSDTTPELRLRRVLWTRGLRYRLHHKTPAGKPDLVFLGPRLAVFIDGCFWHGCPDHYVPPRSSRTFWSNKLRGNVERDRRQTLALEEAGWRVLRFWECEVHDHLDRVAERIVGVVRGGRTRHGTAMRVVQVDFLDPEGRMEERFLEDLRAPDKTASVVRERSTVKWRSRR